MPPVIEIATNAMVRADRFTFPAEAPVPSLRLGQALGCPESVPPLSVARGLTRSYLIAVVNLQIHPSE
jgi:hypothetical protein